MDVEWALFRHVLATIAYRGGRSLRGAAASFAGFRTSEGSRLAVEMLAHMAGRVGPDQAPPRRPF